MSKILVLFSDKNSYYFGDLNIPNVTVGGLFRETSGIWKNILKFLRKINNPLTCLFYQEWYKHIKEYSKIIVFDTPLKYDVCLLKNIKRRSPNAKRFFYSWNVVQNEDAYYLLRSLVEKNGFEYFCYDHGNCEKYNMKFNTIMYDKNARLDYSEDMAIYDTFFLGYLKDRKDKMLKLHNALIKAKLKSHFVITGSLEFKDALPFEFREKYVDYHEYLEMLRRSKSILDISQDGQDGYSMRVMEAIYFNKRLITTNKSVRDSIFYDPNNILILDFNHINVKELTSFFAREFHPYSSDIREYYSFESWLERFQ